MKVVKKINNNVAIGIDGNNKEVVLFGKGIGFPSMPYELNDLSKIDRTFYDVDKRYYQLFEEIDAELFGFIGHMVDVIMARTPGNWDPHLTFILADHINFALKRTKLNMRVGFPYSFDIETEFPEFNKYAKWIVTNINKKMRVHLEKGEITCVAMHLLSAYEGTRRSDEETSSEKASRILNKVMKIIENFFQFKIDKNSINYYRFRYHIQYFVKRKENKEEVMEESTALLDNMKDNYPKTYECICEIEKFLVEEFNEPCSNEELLYLMIHINRLYSKADCNRKGITQE